MGHFPKMNAGRHGGRHHDHDRCWESDESEPAYQIYRPGHSVSGTEIEREKIYLNSSAKT